MRITLVGAGNVGGSLGRAWAAAGHQVIFGVRDPAAKKAALKLATPYLMAAVDTVQGAIAQGEIIVFAVPATVVEPIVQANASELNGKILIDATNDFGPGLMSSIATLVHHAPNAKVFRAFNSLGWENFAHPNFDGEAADLFYCGSSDAAAQQTVESLIQQVGLRPIRVGDLSADPLLDAVLRIWVVLSGAKGRHLAFKVLHD